LSRAPSRFPIAPPHDAARRTFEANESRDLFYRAATELVALALRGEGSLNLAEALAVLLQTWNSAHYRYRKFDAQHFKDIERLITQDHSQLSSLRDRAVADLQPDQTHAIKSLFHKFEIVLGPVGAAKCLHLLAPRFFPLWDRAIAEAYGLRLGAAGTNADRYWSFMMIAKSQCASLGTEVPSEGNALKAIDEYNYCRHTKHWL